MYAPTHKHFVPAAAGPPESCNFRPGSLPQYTIENHIRFLSRQAPSASTPRPCRCCKRQPPPRTRARANFQSCQTWLKQGVGGLSWAEVFPAQPKIFSISSVETP
eukprot:939536-Rhodomonas_salina.1